MARTSVNVQESNNNIVIKEGENLDVNVTQKVTNVVDVTAIGPQGPKGAPGIQGIKGDPGQLQAFQDLTVTGSLFVSGTIEQGNITGSIITASGGFSGSLEGTASFATTASYALNATSASHAILADDAVSASYSNNATNASHAAQASNATSASHAILADDATSASFATTASFALNVPDDTGFPFTGSAGILGNLSVIGSITSSNIISASGFSGSLEGTSSFATTASFALNVPPDTGFPFTGSAEITGSLDVIGPITSSNIISASGFSGSLEGTSSFSNNAEIAEYTSEWNLTADGNSHYIFQGPGFTGSVSDPNIYLVRGQKYKFNNISGGHPFRIQSTVNGALGTQYDNGVTNNNAGSGTTLLFDVPMNAPDVLYYQCTNHNNMGGPIYISHVSGSSGSGFPFTGSALITGSLEVIGPITASGISSSGKISGSTFFGDGSNLSGIGSNPFPFTGSALVSGSFDVIGPFTASTVSLRERFTAAGLDTSGDIIIGNGGGSVVGLTLSSSVGTRLKAFGQNGSNFQLVYHDNAGASRGALIISQSEVSLVNRTPDGKVFIKASGQYGGFGDENTLAEFAHETVTFNYPVTASIVSASTLIGTIESASHAVFADDAESSSFATTASFALNVPADTGFPFTGSAQISGGLQVMGDISSSDTIRAVTYFGNGSNLTGTSGRPFPYNSYVSPTASVTGGFQITGDPAVPHRSGSLIIESGIGSGEFIQLTSGSISASGVISASEFAGNITPLTTFISNSTSDVLFTLRNSNTSEAFTNTVGLHFKHRNSTAAKMIVGKQAPFGTFINGLPAFETSFISLQTPYSGSLKERLRITATNIHRASISTSGDITASNLAIDNIPNLTSFNNVSDGESLINIYNSNNSTVLGSTAGIKFGHGNNKVAGKILAGKDTSYAGGNDSQLFNSNLQFYTAFKGTDVERLRIDASGSISASGAITASDFVGTASFATTASFALNAGSGTGFPFTGSAVISGSLDVIGPITGSHPLTIYNSDELLSSPESYSIKLNPGRLSFFQNPFLDTNQWTAFDFKSNGTKSFLYNSNGIVLETDKTLGFGNSANDFIGHNNNLLEIKATGKNIVLNPRQSGDLGGEIYHSGSFTHISSSGYITGSHFVGDGSNLNNLPQSLAFDGTSKEGKLQYISTYQYDQLQTPSVFGRFITTASLIFSASSGTEQFHHPVIYTVDDLNLTPSTVTGALSKKPSFIFSGSSGFNTGDDGVIDLLISQGGVAIINLDEIIQIDSGLGDGYKGFATGSTLDIRVLEQIKTHLIASQSDSNFNPTNYNFKYLDLFEVNSTISNGPVQIGLSSLRASTPSLTQTLEFNTFNSESSRIQKTFTDIPFVGSSSFFTESVFVSNPVTNKIYTSLETSLQTTFNSNVSSSGQISASVFYGDGSNLTGVGSNPFPFTGNATIIGNLDVSNSITASTISSSGNISGSIFYGDGSQLTNVSASTFPFTGNATITGSLITTGAITSSGIISASGFSGSLQGTSSFATSASYALTASHALNVVNGGGNEYITLSDGICQFTPTPTNFSSASYGGAVKNADNSYLKSTFPLVDFPPNLSVGDSITSFRYGDDPGDDSISFKRQSQAYTGILIPQTITEVTASIQAYNSQNDAAEIKYYIFTGSASSLLPTWTGVSGSMFIADSSNYGTLTISASVNLNEFDKLYIFSQQTSSGATLEASSNLYTNFHIKGK